MLTGPVQLPRALELRPTSLQVTAMGVTLPLSFSLPGELRPILLETVTRGRQVVGFAASLGPARAAAIAPCAFSGP